MSAHVAHQFNDAAQQRESAALGMWSFLVTEVMFFGGVFTAYAVYRDAYFEAFVAGSQHLDRVLGTVNTAVLLTSSLCAALAVHAAQTNQRRALVGYLAGTMLLGGVFLGVKVYEYWDKFQHHLVPGYDFQWPADSSGLVDPRHVELFYSFYFAMTGIHAVHMIIGIALFMVILVRAARGRYSHEYYNPVEIMGLYWHFVDIVWVFLFPLLYLIES